MARTQAPEDHRLAVHQGNALWLADQPGAAWRCFQDALVLAPSCPRTLRGAAQVLRDLNRFEEAEGLHARSDLAADPEPALARWAHSQVLLGLERYRDGFALAEGRPAHQAQPAPLPDPLAPGALSLQSEQGIGDTLQFLRWLPELIGRRLRAGHGEPVTLVVPPPLVHLLREGLAWLESPPQVLPKTQQWLNSEASSGVSSVLSLPHALGGAPLAAAVPYLRSPLWAGAGASLLPQPASGLMGPKVGLVWEAGRKLQHPFTAREYRKRSLPVDGLARLAEELIRQGASLVPLQWGGEAELLDALAVPHLKPRLSVGEFTVTARLVQALDLVISVDTAMAHLVGGMGCPGWVLLPCSADPRWLRDRQDSPWYPSLRLFRQHRPGDWHSAVSDLLAAFAQGLPPRRDSGSGSATESTG